MGADIWLVFRFWGTLFFVGSIAYPLTKVLFGPTSHLAKLELRGVSFRNTVNDGGRTTRPGLGSHFGEGGGLGEGWFDQGYFFSKAVGMATVTFGVFVLGSLKILPFGILSIALSMGVVFLLGLVGNLIDISKIKDQRSNIHIKNQKYREWIKKIALLFLEESVFLGLLIFWAWVKGHEPSIHGLEKFMDFGFTKSILNGGFFPPKDMWYSGFTINYYYFGHLVLATLTRLSGLDLTVTFNLILAALFSLCFTMAGSIGCQLALSKIKEQRSKIWNGVVAWILTGFIVTLAGNMQTIYAFTRGYTGDNVKPFWELVFPLRISFHSSFAGQVGEIWTNLQQGLNTYWYANATRFIPYTIHEFPSYSFVVSDIHGHVLSIPFALLAIALLIQLSAVSRQQSDTLMAKGFWLKTVFYGFLCGVLFMTNALDGPIYIGLFLVVMIIISRQSSVVSRQPIAISHQVSNKLKSESWKPASPAGGLKAILYGVICVISAGITALPFILHFKPFVTGIGVNCPPAFLANHKIGPFLFETIDKCQHSPLWMWWLLWGFFMFCGGGFILSKIKYQKLNIKYTNQIAQRIHSFNVDVTGTEKVLLVFFFVSLGLLIFPEFLYFKDIYPAHFRSNTMFKLGYQAFMMLSIVSVYGITNSKLKSQKSKILFFLLLVPQVFLVSIFPLFSVRSYFNALRTYESIDGLGWMRRQYPSDYAAIEWLNNQIEIKYQKSNIKYNDLVLLEADGDSYTDYARMSAFTGIPAVVGWPVHEWLWRGSYDVVSPRRSDVGRIYETTYLEEARILLVKHGVTHVIIGTLERQKYPNLFETKFEKLGTNVFTSGLTTIYRLTERK
ncbi:hypothetical protein HY947_04055 [Candidatus Gottesmanbacteria bacterium]|nr:hypothetical protein [Candidatus Gottesmanbacteria bacterium]